jgi:hypothetical protein
MRRKLTIALAGALALTTVAAGDADTAHPCYDAASGEVEYAESQVWFHESDSKLGNTVDPVSNPAPATWDATEPTASVTGGNGAIAVTPGVATLGAGTPAEQHAIFEGTFTGCIDTMLLDMYSFDASNRSGHGGAPGGDCLPDCRPSGEPGVMDVGLIIEVDGYEVYSSGEEAVELTSEFDYVGFGPNRNRAVVNMAQAMGFFANAGYLTLDGEHTVTVSVRSWYVNTGHSAFVWDTDEVPSGLTFNGEAPEGVVVVS